MAHGVTPRENLSEDDARLRVMDARLGWRSEATTIYLHRLRKEVALWLRIIDEELVQRGQIIKRG